MSDAGQRNYRGVNAQAKAAILLFLVSFSDREFDSITLEDPSWEDFTLNFTSGKKSVCESKAWSKELVLNDVVNILTKIDKRSQKLGKKDDIIIVCKSVSQRLEKDIEYLNYGAKLGELRSYKSYRKKSKITPSIEKLLKRVKFYRLPSEDLAETEDSLFSETVARLYQLIPFWVPQVEVERLMAHVLKEQIYDKSERGKTFSKNELIDYLNTYRDEKIKEGAYEAEHQKIIKQVDRMVTAAQDNEERHLLAGANLSALSAQPMKMYIALDLIQKTSPFVLEEWDAIWSALIDRTYSFRVLHIFEQSFESKENAEYILDFFGKNMHRLNSPLLDKHDRDYYLDLIAKILNRHDHLTQKGLELVREFLQSRSYLYGDSLGKRDLSLEKQNALNILLAIYDYGDKTQDDDLRKEVIDLIDKSFNLVEDDSEYSLVTPNLALTMIRRWVEIDFESKFSWLIELFESHYAKSKFYGNKFSGWELIGRMESGFAGDYKIHDRNFVGIVLEPLFKSRYEQDPERFWEFAKSDLITTSEKQVSSKKPDYLSRAIIPVLLQEYESGKNSGEALDIIGKFFTMRKGLPERYKLIFQAIKDYDLSIDKKWDVTKSFLDSRGGLPGSVFVEKVVLEIAVSGKRDALDSIESWFDNASFRERQMRWEFSIDDILGALLNSSNKDALETGVKLLVAYLSTKEFQQSLDKFHAWDVTSLISSVLKKYHEAGVKILEYLYSSQDKLPRNVQLAITSSIEKASKDDPETAKYLYFNFLNRVIFDDLDGDIEKIVSKFPEHHAREEIVQFIESLIKANQPKEGLALIKVFIKDPDPSLENYPDDPEGTFNYHQKLIDGDSSVTINTVRVWCAYALQKFVNVSDKEYIDQTLPLVEQLTKDENYYVRLNALVPLTELASNRHTVIPPERTERFMSLETAQKVEDISFAMLEDADNRKVEALVDRLSYTFNFLRSLTSERAKRLFELFDSVEFEEKVEHLPQLYIFFAEFRKNAFKGKTMRRLFGEELYAKLNDYDETYFQDLLKKQIADGSDEMKSSLAWHFWRIVKDSDPKKFFNRDFKMSYQYMQLFIRTYDREVFERVIHFVEDFMEQKPKECLELWKGLVEVESKYIIANADELVNHQHWWGHLHTEDILFKILSEEGEEEFMRYVDLMLDYPDHLPALYKPTNVYEALKKMSGTKAKGLVDKFHMVYPSVYANERMKI